MTLEENLQKSAPTFFGGPADCIEKTDQTLDVLWDPRNTKKIITRTPPKTNVSPEKELVQ